MVLRFFGAFGVLPGYKIGLFKDLALYWLIITE